MKTIRHNRTRAAARFRRGFSLIELLVVIAITAILMVIMFVPLSRSIDMVRRAEASTKAQDSVRTAARRITRELSLAMQVFEPRPLQMWGFNTWTFTNKEYAPTNNALPESYIVNNGVLAMRLPKTRYFDTANAHYVTPQDIDPLNASGLDYDAVALDTCPRHVGAPVELRPLQPLEPDDRIVAYFVALKDPGYQPLGNPTYNNIGLFGKAFGPQQNLLNTYVLYRVEFRESDPRFANWNEDLNRNGVLDGGEDLNGDGQLGPNPAFFYDTRVDPLGNPYWQNWKSIASRSQMDAETSDAIRWEQQGDKYVPRALCTFTASPAAEAVAQPNRGPGQYLLDSPSSQVLPGDLPPLEYTTENAHWGGDGFLPLGPARVASDGTVPIPAAITVGPTGANINGPWITIFEPGSANPVFDSMRPIRDRLVSYDDVKGRVVTAFRRRNFAATGTIFDEHYNAVVDPVNATADLTLDDFDDPNGMPSTFGACKTSGVPAIVNNVRIVPGSEVVLLVDAGSPPTGEQLRRVSWSGLGPGLDQDYVAQNELALNEYKINYQTGEIILSNRDLSYWSTVGPALSRHLIVRYRFTTNHPTDTVKVSYTTKEVLAVNLGVVEFTRKNRESLPFETSEKVVIRNLKR